MALMVIRRRRASDVVTEELSQARRAAVTFAAFGSGACSGLFGVGGGVLVVPALTLLGRLPLKTAATTSSLALMTSAACGGMVYFANGLLRPDVVGVAILGVLPGGFVGSRLQRRVPDPVLEAMFLILGAIVVVLTLVRGLS
jgi:uncharacterized membrane protein YfcA